MVEETNAVDISGTRANGQITENPRFEFGSTGQDGAVDRYEAFALYGGCIGPIPQHQDMGVKNLHQCVVFILYSR